jgi:hypothetical protein
MSPARGKKFGEASRSGQASLSTASEYGNVQARPWCEKSSSVLYYFYNHSIQFRCSISVPAMSSRLLLSSRWPDVLLISHQALSSCSPTPITSGRSLQAARPSSGPFEVKKCNNAANTQSDSHDALECSATILASPHNAAFSPQQGFKVTCLS